MHDSSNKTDPDTKKNKKELPTTEQLLTLRPTLIWKQMKSEPFYFWTLCCYLLFEYVRPQSVWKTIDVLPYAQIFILLTIAGLFTEKNIYKYGNLANKLVIAFAIIINISMLNSFFGIYEFDKFVERFLVWMIIYFMIILVVNTEKRFFIFLFLFIIFNIKMSQHGFRSWVMSGFGFTDWGVTCSPGFFQNSGECGAEMAIFLPIGFYACVILKDYFNGWKYYLFWFMPISAFGTAIASSSRGALLACACAMIWITAKSQYKIRAIAGLSILAVLVILIVPPEFMARFESAGDDSTSTQRLEYWKAGLEIMHNFPVLGVGFAQWVPFYRAFYEADYFFGVQLPHNIFIEVGAEMGYVGLSVFILLIVYTFVLNARTRKICTQNDKFIFYFAHAFDAALIGYLVAGFFVTITYYPFFWVNLAFTVSLHTVARRKYNVAKNKLVPNKITNRKTIV